MQLVKCVEHPARAAWSLSSPCRAVIDLPDSSAFWQILHAFQAVRPGRVDLSLDDNLVGGWVIEEDWDLRPRDSP